MKNINKKTARKKNKEGEKRVRKCEKSKRRVRIKGGAKTKRKKK